MGPGITVPTELRTGSRGSVQPRLAVANELPGNENDQGNPGPSAMMLSASL
jgi:hypothetical protein